MTGGIGESMIVRFEGESRVIPRNLTDAEAGITWPL